MTRKFILLLLIISSFKLSNAQDNCLKNNLRYLFCLSKRWCSEHENNMYHREIINQYLTIIAKHENELVGDDFNQLGKEYYYIKELDSALHYYKLASNFVDSFGSYNNNIGTIYFEKGNYEDSYLYFNKAFHIDSTQQDYMNNIASYFGTIGEYKKSIYWSEKSLKINQSKSANLVALNSLRISYQLMKKKSKMKYYEKLFKIEQERYYEPKKEENCDCVKPNCMLN